MIGHQPAEYDQTRLTNVESQGNKQRAANVFLSHDLPGQPWSVPTQPTSLKKGLVSSSHNPIPLTGVRKVFGAATSTLKLIRVSSGLRGETHLWSNKGNRFRFP